jgi:plasmid stability protein
MSAPQKPEERMTIRLPVGTIDRLKRQAAQHQRSINGETVWAILRYLDSQEQVENNGKS